MVFRDTGDIPCHLKTKVSQNLHSTRPFLVLSERLEYSSTELRRLHQQSCDFSTARTRFASTKYENAVSGMPKYITTVPQHPSWFEAGFCLASRTVAW